MPNRYGSLKKLTELTSIKTALLISLILFVSCNNSETASVQPAKVTKEIKVSRRGSDRKGPPLVDTLTGIIIKPVSLAYNKDVGEEMTLFTVRNHNAMDLYYTRTLKYKLYNPTYRVDFYGNEAWSSTQCGYWEKHEFVKLEPNKLDTLRTYENFAEMDLDSTILGFSFYLDSSFDQSTTAYLTIRDKRKN